jgi:SAM-dependent methyltransferase
MTQINEVDSNRGFQKIYAADGISLLSEGWWDPKKILATLDQSIGYGDPDFWRGKRVIDIGANSCGLSIEIARRGAKVVAIEPDSRATDRYRMATAALAPEGLELEVRDGVLEDVVSARESCDIILFLGLLYHFKYPHFIIQSLASLPHRWLLLSTQCTDKAGLVQVNRLEEMPERMRMTMTGMTGWHLSRELLTQSLMDAGYRSVREGSDPKIHFKNKPRDVTNSTYVCAEREHSDGGPRDVISELYKYYPR